MVQIKGETGGGARAAPAGVPAAVRGCEEKGREARMDIRACWLGKYTLEPACIYTLYGIFFIILIKS